MRDEEVGNKVATAANYALLQVEDELNTALRELDRKTLRVKWILSGITVIHERRWDMAIKNEFEQTKSEPSQECLPSRSLVEEALALVSQSQENCKTGSIMPQPQLFSSSVHRSEIFSCAVITPGADDAMKDDGAFACVARVEQAPGKTPPSKQV